MDSSEVHTSSQLPDAPVVLTARDLVLTSGTELPSLDIALGLTLLHCGRENSATTLSLTLAGRMKPKSGIVMLHSAQGEMSTPKQLHKHVALAGIPEFDSLERLVPVKAVVREHVAWTNSWWRRVPSSIEKIDSFVQAAELLGIHATEAFAKRKVGDLDPLERFTLRIALALTVRPEADLLIVDDIDQIRSLRLRADLLRQLKVVAEVLPVVTVSANSDVDGICDADIPVAGALKRAQEREKNLLDNLLQRGTPANDMNHQIQRIRKGIGQ
ncbi:hypothetical protein [Corynebacterium pseudotuberculosis]|uniref:hypothetical protein n=1 Tax=Corynebacterium pseudotuberculosis TaxID=1719 RepID=UPI0004D0E4B3|nr:hypothetical protein [Corynebacterium pseudotuberculosis]AIG12007.1 hypothetical protein CPTC_01719 [Corynebacterium pseudotuberculosis]